MRKRLSVLIPGLILIAVGTAVFAQFQNRIASQLVPAHAVL